MSIRKIIPSDKLESGFRSKYNETADEIITSANIDPSGKLQLVKYNNGKIEIDLTGQFYTEVEINQMLSDITALIGGKPFDYTGANLNANGEIILVHNLNTHMPEVTIFADGVRETEVNVKVETFDNGNGRQNSIRITHYAIGNEYKVKIKK